MKPAGITNSSSASMINAWCPCGRQTQRFASVMGKIDPGALNQLAGYVRHRGTNDVLGTVDRTGIDDDQSSRIGHNEFKQRPVMCASFSTIVERHIVYLGNIMLKRLSPWFQQVSQRESRFTARASIFSKCRLSFYVNWHDIFNIKKLKFDIHSVMIVGFSRRRTISAPKTLEI